MEPQKTRLDTMEENSIGDIRRFFEGPNERPLQPNEFVAFWKSLSEEDKDEFKKADLSA
jgi:hypothetical protein